MVLNLRQRQIDAIVRMLHFNANPGAAVSRGDDEVFKVLVLDRYTKDVLAPLLRVNDLRKHGVTLHLMLENERQPIPDVPAVYFVSSTDGSVDRIAADAEAGLYDTLYINFVGSAPRPLLERMAGAMVQSGCSQRVSQVFDKYLSFVALEGSLFSLAQPDAYLELNDPTKRDSDIEAAVGRVVDGLFCVLVTLGVVPVIRCPKGGAAEHVAQLLDQRLRQHLQQRNNLLTEAGGGLAGSLSRPLLCLFDRNFELSVVLQHSWTYKPMVHDVLGMSLNRVTLDDAAAAAGSSGPSSPRISGHGSSKKSYEVGETDFFWGEHGRKQFPKVAEEVENLVSSYKQAAERITRQGGGVESDPGHDPEEATQEATRNLMAAVSSLPELTDKKRIMDKHTDIATALLGQIKARELDKFYNVEEDMLGGKGDVPTIEKLLSGPRGSPTDKLRLVLVYLLTCEQLPGDDQLQRLEQGLAAVGADMSALRYVLRMRKMNLTGGNKVNPSASIADNLASLGGAGGGGSLLNWADRTFGQGLSSLTKGVKNLLAGEQQAAVTVAVEQLMAGQQQAPEATDGFAYFDPKAAPGRAARQAAPFKEAMVFMIGGGNYLEYESLATWASRSQPPKSVMYGATELLTGEQFVRQLAELGVRSSS